MAYIVKTGPVKQISAIVDGMEIWDSGDIEGVLMSDEGVVLVFRDKNQIHAALEDMCGHEFQDVDELLEDLGWEAVEVGVGTVYSWDVYPEYVEFEKLEGDPERVTTVRASVLEGTALERTGDKTWHSVRDDRIRKEHEDGPTFDMVDYVQGIPSKGMGQ